eukprot:gene11603-15499_t
MSEEECTLDQLSCRHGEQLPWVHSFSSAVIFIGAILGQLSMGYIAIIPTNNATTVYSAIITLRFFLGIGLGGIFPLTATKSSEDNGDSSGLINPVRTAWTFFWQMPGTMAPCVHDRRSLSTSQSEQPTLTYWTLAKYLISTGGVWMLFDFIGFGVSLSG